MVECYPSEFRGFFAAKNQGQMQWRGGNRDEGKEFQLLDAWSIQGRDFLDCTTEDWDFLIFYFELLWDLLEGAPRSFFLQCAFKN